MQNYILKVSGYVRLKSLRDCEWRVGPNGNLTNLTVHPSFLVDKIEEEIKENKGCIYSYSFHLHLRNCNIVFHVL